MTCAVAKSQVAQPVKVIARSLLAYVVAQDGSKLKARIFLDSGGELNLIKRSVARKIGFNDSRKVTLRLAVAGGLELPPTLEHEVSFSLMSLDGNYISPKVNATTVEKITKEICAVNFDPQKQYGHLANITFADQYPRAEVDVDVMIGEPLYSLLETGVKVHSELLNEPCAVKTKLGWVLAGAYPCSTHGENVGCYRVARVASIDKVGFEKQVTDFFNVENGLLSGKEEVASIAEAEALQLMAEVTQYDACSKAYSTKLLWNEHKMLKSDGYFKAKAIMASVQKRCEKSGQLDLVNNSYKEFLRNGFAEKVDPNVCPPHDVYYIPTHAVFNPKSLTTPCRIVHDASVKNATNGDRSLNEMLMSGPALQADLLKMLLRMKQAPILISADLSKMYFRTKLRDEADRDCMRFVWHFSGDDEITVMRMTGLVFGVISSPFQAIWVVQDLAKCFQNEYPLAYDAVMNSLYVDDLIHPCRDVAEAKETIRQLLELFEKGSMPIQKWNSNSKEVLAGIPNCEQPPDEVSILGVRWDTVSDQLSLNFVKSIIDVAPSKETKHTVAQQIASIFDVQGLTQPFVMSAKMLFQDLWLKDLQWDDLVPPDVLTKYLCWKDQLKDLQTETVPRFMLQDGKISHQYIAVFGDASFKGYGAVAYLVTFYSDRPPTQTILMSKGRVAPKTILEPKELKNQAIKDADPAKYQQLTIVRLELLAAVLAAQLGTYLCKCLNIKNLDIFTDSMITLCRLKRPPKSYQQWVGNKLLQIFKYTNDPSVSACFHFVPSQLNPSDLVSRGTEINELLGSKLWWEGPGFLSLSKNLWPPIPGEELAKTSVTDSDLKTPSAMFAASAKTAENDLLDRLCQISDYTKIVQVLHFLLKWRRCLDNKSVMKAVRTARSKKINSITVASSDFKTAETCLWRLVQGVEFDRECQALQKQQDLPKDNYLKLLNIFLDKNDGLLKLNTRLRLSNLQSQTKFPILLPKHNDFVEKFVLFNHFALLHCGTSQTLALINHRFHILGGRQEVRRILHSCKTPRCQKPERFAPPMAPLPALRIDAPEPFVNVAVDYFGPVYIKHYCDLDACPHDKIMKAWGCLFGCFHTRALHIELTTTMGTDGFLECLSRFIARRGRPRTILSDCAKYFKSASRELRNLLRSIDFDQVQQSKYGTQIEWIFNVERMSWAAGLIERMVATVKKPLRVVLGNASLNFFQTQLLLFEIESVINDRPLDSTRDDSNDLISITPAELCIGRKLHILPDGGSTKTGQVQATDFTKIHRARRVLLNHFWRLWHRDYLQKQSIGKKWQNASNQPIAQVDDVVLVHDDNLPKNAWKLAIIDAVHASQDGTIRSATLRLTRQDGKITKINRPLRKLSLLEGRS